MTLSFPPRNRTAGFLDVLGLMGACGLLVARYVPLARLPFWGCTLREQTGWPCPGCGLTRVAERISQGNLAGAWEANPLGAVVACLFALLAVWTLVHLLFAAPMPEVQLRPREARGLRLALLAALVFNYAYVVVKVRFS